MRTPDDYNRMSKKKLLALLAASNLIGEERSKIIEVEDAVKTASALIGDWRQEHLVAIYLDTSNAVLEARVLFIGTLNQSLSHPREIFGVAMEQRAFAIILLHNHPSGDVKPSSDDLNVTKRLVDCGKLIGIEIIDHIIFSAKKHYSFKTKGQM